MRLFTRTEPTRRCTDERIAAMTLYSTRARRVLAIPTSAPHAVSPAGALDHQERSDGRRTV